MRFSSILLACALGVGSLQAAEDVRPELAKQLNDAPFTVSLDYAGLLEVAKTAKPTSIWWDPELQGTRDYITEQITRAAAMERRMPPFLEAIKSGIGLVVVGYDSIPEAREPQFAALLDFGDAAIYWKEWMGKELKRERDGQIENAGELNGFTGFYERRNNDQRQKTGGFVGFKDNVMLGCMASAVSKPVTTPVNAEIFQAHFTLDIQLSKILDRIKAISEGGRWDRYGFKQWGRFVEGIKPNGSMQIGIENGEWFGQTLIEGLLDHNAKPVGDEILNSIPSGALSWVVFNFDSQAIVHHLRPHVPMEADQMVQAQFGATWAEMLNWFGGDVSFAVRPSALIPEMTISIALKNKEGVAGLLNKFLAPMGQVVNIDGAEQAWSVMVPDMPMPLYVGFNDKLLTVSSNQMTVGAVLKGEGLADASAAKGKAMHAWLNVPLIAQSYLPMVYGMTANINEPLQSTPMDRARWSLNEAYSRMLEDGQVDAAALSEVLKDRWTGDAIKAVFPEAHDVASACLKTFSVWAGEANNNGRNRNLVIFYRSQDGIMVFSNWENPRVIDVAAAAELCNGLKKAAGPNIGDLPMLNIEKPPMFDRHWFPPLPKVIEHLPEYSLSVEAKGPGAVLISETGIPYLSMIMGGVGTVFWFETAERHAREMHNKARQAEEKAVMEDVDAEVEVEEVEIEIEQE